MKTKLLNNKIEKLIESEKATLNSLWNQVGFYFNKKNRKQTGRWRFFPLTRHIDISFLLNYYLDPK